MRISIPNSDLSYYLVSFDKHGSERREDQGFQSDELKTLVASEQDPVTDVFLVTHGWKGDVPAAIEQCDRWMGEMAKMGRDRLAVREKEPGFRALLLGIHWPSQPWGDESLAVDDGGALLLGGAAGAPDGLDAVVDQYADSISDSPDARAAIERIVRSSSEDAGKLKLSSEVIQAYATLVSEADLWSEEVDAGQLNMHWNPQDVYELARTSQANDLVLGGIKDVFLSPLRQLSFWTMKSRARKVGETGVARLLRELQGATARPVRFHLMGHSFGCIVSSAAIAGTGWQPLARPVSSLFLVQGALSLWSYGASGSGAGQPGYFERIVSQKRVAGPIVTTWSEHDSAVGNLYPMAARLARQVVMVAYPKYGGVGSFGLQGVGGGAREIGIENPTHEYAFQPGSICNVNASTVIKNGSGPSGAHSDIAHPEVAHVAWQSVLGSL